MKRVLAIVVAGVLLAGMVPIGAAFGVTPTRSIDGHYPLVLAPGGQVQPAIDWPYVAFKDGRYDALGINDEEPHIRIYNMETGREFAVNPDNKGLWEQSNPSISGTKVVYSDQRNVYETGCDVYMYDIKTGTETLICDAPDGQGNPFIDGDTVAWVDWRNRAANGADIYMKDLTTGVESVVVTATSDQREPVVWDDYVVWRDQRDGGFGSIYMKDLASGEETCIAEGWRASSYPYEWVQYADPYVADGVVAFQRRSYVYNGSGFDNLAEIMLHDIATGTTKSISTTTTDNRWHPEVGGGWVTWTDRRSGEMEVYGFEIATGEEYCLVPYNADGDGSYGGRSAVGDGWVLWHDHRAGDGDDGASDLYGMSLECFTDGTIPPTQAMPLQGGDRYETAVDVSRQAFPAGADTLVISTGKNWPDALAGASLAGAYDAPILLVGDTLPAAVGEEVERLSPSQLFLLGEENAVSSGVFGQLASIVGTDTITRLGGADRYETACIVASETVNALGDGWDGTAFATTGNNWPDALAASPLAAWAGYPVFLADSDGFDDVTEQCMSDLGVTGAIVLGGTVAMPLSVMAQVERAGVTEIARVGGDTRYETAALIAEFGVEQLGMSYDVTGISTGKKFPDALSAGAVLGADGYVMLLTPGWYLHAAPKTYLETHCDAISQIRFIGGTAALKQSVRDEVLSYVH